MNYSAGIPRNEYPRPDFERKEWMNLNGEWEFEFDDSNVGELKNWYKNQTFSKHITIPFCYQSELSGINDRGIHENVWYRKEFDLPDSFIGKRILLNFGAVDYIAKIWINGEFSGIHKGGHTPFKIDISRFVKNSKNIIVVKAEDSNECSHPRGKQYWKEKPDRCWYTPTTGIWQTVWLEAVGEVYIDRVKINPDIDKRNISAEIFLDNFLFGLQLSVEITYKNSVVKYLTTTITDRIFKLTLDFKEDDYIDEIHYWTPETPNLYDIKFKLLKDCRLIDIVMSYFGMRKISIKDDFILLNNKPYYQKLILDQGYWPESLLTPPSDEAIKFDIEMTKKLGFNGVRKHQKIEDPRYYYWADKLGLLVWGEMPSGYNFNDEEVENITQEWMEYINRDFNHPCIITWVPLNESWGVRNILVDKNQQSFGKALYYLTKAIDGTRLVSTNDGWEQVKSDICAIHDYIANGDDFTKKYLDKKIHSCREAGDRMIFCEGTKYEGQPILITEFGGIAFETDGKENWGYFGAVRDEEEFLNRYSSITYAIKNIPFIRGYCYTQLTDVMQEINGLMTADRKLKVDIEKIRKVNA